MPMPCWSGHMNFMSDEESSSSDSEASDNVDDTRNLAEGVPRISSGALIYRRRRIGAIEV